MMADSLSEKSTRPIEFDPRSAVEMVLFFTVDPNARCPLVAARAFSFLPGNIERVTYRLKPGLLPEYDTRDDVATI